MAKPMINVDLIWPVQSLYLTTDENFNPNTAWGGTWARLGGDAYLKNVPAGATGQPIGNYGGTTSNHTIPVTSMPKHSHGGLNWAGRPFSINSGTTCIQLTAQSWSTGDANANYWGTGETGGSQPYYPYYYGVIVWKRTA